MMRNPVYHRVALEQAVAREAYSVDMVDTTSVSNARRASGNAPSAPDCTPLGVSRPVVHAVVS